MPSTPFVVPPLLLIVILTVSGSAKLRATHDTVSVMQKLKLPRFLFRLKAPLLLPWAELAVAALLLLLPGPAYVVATTLALLLFAAYVVVVARALTFGYAIMCGCFGRLGLGWITKQTLVRNVVLLAVAAVAWVDSFRGDGVISRLRQLDATGWWWLVWVAVTMVVTGLVVRESKQPTPDFVNPDLDAEYRARPVPYGFLEGPDGPGSVWRLTDTSARMLVFWDPRKEEADTIAGRLPYWQTALAPVQVHLVSGCEWETARDLRPDLAEHLLGDPDGETGLRLGVHEMPGAVILGTDRLLAGGPARGMGEIEELVEAAAEEIRAATAALVDNDEATASPQV